MYTNINGKLEAADAATVPADNRAFRYGHGLFETMLCRDGQVLLADYHWERLFGGMQVLGFDVPKLFTPEWLEAEVLRTVQKNKLEQLCRIRLQVWPGSGGLYDATSRKPQFVIECFALDEAVAQLNEAGLSIGIAEGLQKSMDTLANLKSSNALFYAVAAQQAKANRWNDALVANTNGHLIESTIANLWWVQGDTIYTPPLADGCVAGVMRRHLLEVLPAKGYHVQEQHCTFETLAEADGVFLTNAIRGVKWVSVVGEQRYGLHPIVVAVGKVLTK